MIEVNMQGGRYLETEDVHVDNTGGGGRDL